LEDGGGGVGVEDVDALDATAGGFDFFAANDLIAGPVATLDEDIGKKSGDDGARSGFVEDEDSVDAFEAGEDFGALVLRNDRAARSFEGANAAIAVDADDEVIAEGAGGFETADVSGVQKIEAAIGEDNFAAVAFLRSKPQNRLFQSEDGIHIEKQFSTVDGVAPQEQIAAVDRKSFAPEGARYRSGAEARYRRLLINGRID
jgi:hypothetical protein